MTARTTRRRRRYSPTVGGFTNTGLFGKRGTPDALHPPLTTITLAPVAWATDDSELAYRFTVALAGIGVVLLIGLIGREAVGPRAGLIGAGLAAVYPNLWMNDGLVMSETFAALGTAATIFCTYRLIRHPTWRNAAGAGVACALAMLSRAELVLLIPLLIVPAALTIRGLRQAQRVRLTGVAIAMALLVVAPWVIFNTTRFDRPVFLANGDTGVLTGANCKETYSGRLLGSWFGLCTFSDYRMHDAHLVLVPPRHPEPGDSVHARSSRSSPARGLGPRRSRLERLSSLPGRR